MKPCLETDLPFIWTTLKQVPRCQKGSLSSTNTATTCESSTSSAFDYRDITALASDSWHSNISEATTEISDHPNKTSNNQANPNSITIVDFVDTSKRKGSILPAEEVRVSYLIPDLQTSSRQAEETGTRSPDCENDSEEFNAIGSKGTQVLLPKGGNLPSFSEKANNRNHSEVVSFPKKKFDHPKSRLKMTLAKERKASTTLGEIEFYLLVVVYLFSFLLRL